MSTADELRQQLADLEREESALKNASTSRPVRKGYLKSKLYDGTKLAIIAVILFLALIGVLGSMHFGIFVAFSMDDFVQFLGAFSPIFITLTGSIGLGGTAKNIAKSIVESKKITTEGAVALGEEMAKGGV